MKSNKFLCCAGIGAILFIAFYYFTYDLPESWHNAHVLVDIVFQLSLALIANLMFYFFQVHLPLKRRTAEMQSTIKPKIKSICSLIESPILDIAQMYLGDRKALENFTDVEMRKILENYDRNDFILSWKRGDEEKPYSFGENVQNNFEKARQEIDDLLTMCSPYLDDTEKDILIQLEADHFYELLTSPLSALKGVIRVTDEKQIDEFKLFQQKYTKAKEILQYKEG